ncbi:MAG: methylmalonyl-CoA epimerase [archaeon]|mgnify:FL=1|nr:methylmalonyl-CoA epimerase [archaeon]MDA1130333.1 methylmalonyl-CoA epimerase [archaeon]
MDFGSIHIDHIGIATSDLESASHFWKLIGLIQGSEDETVVEQGVTTRFFSTSPPDESVEQHPPMVELLQPTSAETPIGNFLAKRGPGIQQLCFRVEKLQQLIDYLLDNGIQMIDAEPKLGAGGSQIAFVHPKSTGGVLVELKQSNH